MSHMTTTPAMPELPEPDLGYIETDKSRQPAFSARQMRAAMQAKPAEVSDAGLYDTLEPTSSDDECNSRGCDLGGQANHATSQCGESYSPFSRGFPS